MNQVTTIASCSRHFMTLTRCVSNSFPPSLLPSNVIRKWAPQNIALRYLQLQTLRRGFSSSSAVPGALPNTEHNARDSTVYAAQSAPAAKSLQSDQNFDRDPALTPSGSESAPKPFKEIPGPKGLYQLPFVGTMLLFKPFSKFSPNACLQMYEGLFKRYGPIVRVQMGMSTVLVYEPADLETMKQSEGKYPRRQPFGLTDRYNVRRGLKAGLGESHGEEWHRLRSPLNRHLLKVDSAIPYLEGQSEVADQLVTTLMSFDGSTEEMRDLFYRYACESIGLICFNTRLGLMEADWADDEDARNFVDNTQAMFQVFHKVLSGESMMHHFYANNTYLQYEKHNDFLHSYVDKKLHAAMEVLKKEQAEGKATAVDPGKRNLLNSLLSEGELDYDDVKVTLNTLCVAGLDSTAKNLQVFFYMMALNPTKQEKLYEEIMSVLGETGTVTKDALDRMPYLKACIKESFRIHYPTMSGPTRILPKDTVIHDYLVPAGTQVISCNPITCKWSFSQPEEFLPERWARSEGQRKLSADIPQLACQPFGYGPRHCIGKRFAEQEMYLASIKVLQKARIEIDPQSRDMSFVYSVFIQPVDAIKFRFIDRKGAN